MTQTVTVTPASIADLIEQRDGLLEALKGLHSVLGRAESNASGNPEWEHVSSRINAARAAIAKASPIAGLTEIGEEEVKNSTASQSEPVLTPKSAIGDAENGGPKHTPGPWEADKVEGCWVVFAGGEAITQIRWWESDNDGERADAHLIAAAPELLEALRLFRGRLRPYTSGTDEAIRKADAATAKAEGRAPTSRSAPDDGALAPITPGDSGRTQP